MTDSVAETPLQQAASARQAYDLEPDPGKRDAIGQQWLASVRESPTPEGVAAARIMAVDLTPRPALPTQGSIVVPSATGLAEAAHNEWARRVRDLPSAQGFLAASTAVRTAPSGSSFRAFAGRLASELSLR